MRQIVTYFFQSIYFKVLIISLITVGIFEFMVNGGFSDAILNFCFGGIVPGSNHVLDPETVVMGVTITIGLALVIMFVTILYRMIAVRKATATQMLHLGEAASYEFRHGQIVDLKQTAITDDNPDTGLINNYTIGQKTNTKHLIKLRYIWVRYRPMLVWFYSICQWAHRALRKSSENLFWLLRLAAKNISYSIMSFIAIAVTGLKIVRHWQLQTWVAMKPYAMRFDTWLEVNYQVCINKAVLKLKYFEGLAIISCMVRDSYHATRQYSKSKLKSKSKV